MTRGPTFEVLSLFPEAVADFLRAGLVGKAIQRGLVEVHCTDIRDFTDDRHRTVDDAPFGGGAGMVMKIEPVVQALEAVERLRGPAHRILLTPTGERFDQDVAAVLARTPRISLLCGRYEGIDDRVREHFVHRALSLGDFVLNGGEVAALAVIEAVSRLCEGVLGNPDSLADESFHGRAGRHWLEYPHYTRPAEFRGLRVPDVLLSGDHGAIARWRAEQAEQRSRVAGLGPSTLPILPGGAPVYVALVNPDDPSGAEMLAQVIRHHGLAGLVLVGPEDGRSEPSVQGWAEAAGGRVALTRVADLASLERRLHRAHGGPPEILGLSVPSHEDEALFAQIGLPDPADSRRPDGAAWVLAVELGGTLGGSGSLGARAVQIAPNRSDPALLSVLALPDAMIDSSQPWPARVAIVIDRIMGVLRPPTTHP